MRGGRGVSGGRALASQGPKGASPSERARPTQRRSAKQRMRGGRGVTERGRRSGATRHEERAGARGLSAVRNRQRARRFRRGRIASSRDPPNSACFLLSCSCFGRRFSPKISARNCAFRTGSDESDALRSVGHSAGRLGRGGPGRAAPPDPEILREDARRSGQRRRGAALHQSCQPHTGRPRPARALRRGARGLGPARPSSASRMS